MTHPHRAASSTGTSRIADLGRALLSQPHSLERTRSGRPFRRIRDRARRYTAPSAGHHPRLMVQHLWSAVREPCNGSPRQVQDSMPSFEPLSLERSARLLSQGADRQRQAAGVKSATIFLETPADRRSAFLRLNDRSGAVAMTPQGREATVAFLESRRWRLPKPDTGRQIKLRLLHFMSKR